jgi:hypothetical protein
LARLARVAELIEGFEPPYGMELLATVHWVNHRGGPNGEARAVTPVEATARVHDWSARKRQLLKPEQIQSAWEQLEARGWLADVGGASAKTPVNATISTTQTGV